MNAIEFKKEYVDIVKLLNSTIAVGDYRGHEVWTKIEKLMNSVSDGTLVLVDLRKAIYLNSRFCGRAFGPMFRSSKNQKWPCKYVLFQMYNFLRSVFFYGIMKYLGTELPRKESESGFISTGMYVKLMIGDEELIHFVGNLNENEKTILNVVNDFQKVTSGQIVKKTGLAAETAVDALRSLEQKYFVIEHSSKDGKVFHYFSFYNYLRKEEIK